MTKMHKQQIEVYKKLYLSKSSPTFKINWPQNYRAKIDQKNTARKSEEKKVKLEKI